MDSRSTCYINCYISTRCRLYIILVPVNIPSLAETEEWREHNEQQRHDLACSDDSQQIVSSEEHWGGLNLFTLCVHISKILCTFLRGQQNDVQVILQSPPHNKIFQLILPDLVRWGKRKDGGNVRTFCCCSVLQLLPFYFLYFSQPDWSSVSRLDLPMPRLSWGLKFHWAQHRCAWKLHILNWWLHKSRSRGNADSFGLELGRALKKKNKKMWSCCCKWLIFWLGGKGL